MLRVSCDGAMRGGKTTGKVRFTSGAGCDVSLLSSLIGTASSLPSLRANVSACAEYLSVASPFGKSDLKSMSPVSATVENHPLDKYCSKYCARASACFIDMR